MVKNNLFFINFIFFCKKRDITIKYSVLYIQKENGLAEQG